MIMNLVMRPLRLLFTLLVVSVFLGFLFYEMTTILGTIWFIFMIMVGVVFVHELGHTLSGFLMGLDFRQMTVGPIHIVRTRTGLRVVENRSWHTVGGMVTMVPRHQSIEKHQLIIYLLGGPLFSLLAATISLFGLWWLHVEQTLFLYISAFVNLSIFLLTIIPTHKENINDGGYVWLLMYNAINRCDVVNLMQIQAAFLSEKEPKTWDQMLIASVEQQTESEEKRNSPFVTYDVRFLFYYYTDAFGLHHAIKRLAPSIDLLVKPSRLYHHAYLINLFYSMKMQCWFIHELNETPLEYFQEAYQMVGKEAPVYSQRARLIMSCLNHDAKNVQDSIMYLERNLGYMEHTGVTTLEHRLFQQLKEKATHFIQPIEPSSVTSSKNKSFERH